MAGRKRGALAQGNGRQPDSQPTRPLASQPINKAKGVRKKQGTINGHSWVLVELMRGGGCGGGTMGTHHGSNVHPSRGGGDEAGREDVRVP